MDCQNMTVDFSLMGFGGSSYTGPQPVPLTLPPVVMVDDVELGHGEEVEAKLRGWPCTEPIKSENPLNSHVLGTCQEMYQPKGVQSKKGVQLMQKIQPPMDFTYPHSGIECEELIRNLPVESLVESTPEESGDKKNHPYLIEKSIEIKPLLSEKKKNPPYLVKGRVLTTKNEIPVAFVIKGAEAQQRVLVSMRYTDEQYKRSPVKPCKLHQDFQGKPMSLPPEFDFFVTNPAEYEINELGHPTGIIDIQQDQIDEDGDFKFFVVFFCLNSCHRGYGKKVELNIEVFQRCVLLKKESIQIRICKNVKRDHKCDAFGAKRKTMETEDDNVEMPSPAKKMKTEEVPENSKPSQVSAEHNQGQKYFLFQMSKPVHETVICALIKELGGSLCEVQPPLEQQPAVRG